jgi:hypothetical protein
MVITQWLSGNPRGARIHQGFFHFGNFLFAHPHHHVFDRSNLFLGDLQTFSLCISRSVVGKQTAHGRPHPGLEGGVGTLADSPLRATAVYLFLNVSHFHFQLIQLFVQGAWLHWCPVQAVSIAFTLLMLSLSMVFT